MVQIAITWLLAFEMLTYKVDDFPSIRLRRPPEQLLFGGRMRSVAGSCCRAASPRFSAEF